MIDNKQCNSTECDHLKKIKHPSQKCLNYCWVLSFKIYDIKAKCFFTQSLPEARFTNRKINKPNQWDDERFKPSDAIVSVSFLFTSEENVDGHYYKKYHVVHY